MRERETMRRRGRGRSPEVRRPLVVICRKRTGKKRLQAKRHEREGARGLGGSTLCHLVVALLNIF